MNIAPLALKRCSAASLARFYTRRFHSCPGRSDRVSGFASEKRGAERYRPSLRKPHYYLRSPSPVDPGSSDQVVVLVEGVAEKGSYLDLLRRGGIFAAMAGPSK